MTNLNGKVAIVTGGASGIGRSTALLLGQSGARVVVADMTEAGGHAVAREINEAGGQAFFQLLDVCSEEQCAAMVEATLSRYGQLDIAFNNAGISGTLSLTEEQGLEQWRHILDVNLTGVFNSMVPELKAMQRNGGSIVNTASVAGVVGAPGAAAYSASKHGVIGLTRTAALEYGKHGIRVNAVCPGYVSTPMTTGLHGGFPDNALQKGLARAAIRRLAEPRELAEMVLWLCSDKASYVTGAHFIVDGGISA